MVLQSYEVTLASYTWVRAPAWAAQKKTCLGCTDRQVLFVLLRSSCWSDDLWLLTLQYLLLLAHTSGSTHHPQSLVVWESRVETSTCVPQTFLCRRATAGLCYHKHRVRTSLRHPRGRMGRVGGCSPSHIAVPVSGSFLGSCVIAGVPGRTSVLFSSSAGYWSQCNLLPSKFI